MLPQQRASDLAPSESVVVLSLQWDCSRSMETLGPTLMREQPRLLNQLQMMRASNQTITVEQGMFNCDLVSLHDFVPAADATRFGESFYRNNCKAGTRFRDATIRGIRHCRKKASELTRAGRLVYPAVVIFTDGEDYGSEASVEAHARGVALAVQDGIRVIVVGWGDPRLLARLKRESESAGSTFHGSGREATDVGGSIDTVIDEISRPDDHPFGPFRQS